MGSSLSTAVSKLRERHWFSTSLADAWRAASRWLAPDRDSLAAPNQPIAVLKVTEEGIDRQLMTRSGTMLIQAKSAALMVLMLPEETTLQQAITLPDQARRRLAEAVEHNLSQWSPFSPEDVFVAYSAGSPRSGTFQLALRYALRSDVQPFLDKARAADLAPDMLALGGLDWLAVLDEAAIRDRLERLRRFRLLSLLAVLFGLGLWLAIDWRLEARLDNLRSARQQAIAELRSISDDILGLRRIAAAHAYIDGKPPHYRMLQQLSSALPASAVPLSLKADRTRIQLGLAQDPGEISQELASRIPWVEKLAQQSAPSGAALTLELKASSAR